MSNLFASIFTGFGAFLAGMFGGHMGMNASTTPPMMHQPSAPWMASTTAMGGMPMQMLKNAVFGVVEGVDGMTITVDGHYGTSTMATTTYSVDASNAKIIKGSATGTSTVSVSDISVGDHVLVQGTVNSDYTVIATTIIDGIFMRGGPGGMSYGRGMGSSTGPWAGRMGSTTGEWNNGASSTPGMHHPTPGTPPPHGQGQGGMNPGGPMIPYGGAGANAQVHGQAGMQGGPGANVNVNVGAGVYPQ